MNRVAQHLTMPPVVAAEPWSDHPEPPPTTKAAGPGWSPSTAWRAREAPRPNNPLAISPLLASREFPDRPRKSKKPRGGIPNDRSQPAQPFGMRSLFKRSR